MAKERLLLKNDVAHVGSAGDIVEVAAGLSRNFLLPRKLAVPATDDVVRRHEGSEERRRKNAEKKRVEAEALAKRLTDVSVTVQAAAGPDGKLYGSVGAKEIAKLLAAEGFAVKAEAIELPEPLKEAGTHTVTLRLHADVAATVKVWIVEK